MASRRYERGAARFRAGFASGAARAPAGARSIGPREFLLLTGIKLLLLRESEPDPSRHPVVRWVRRFLPITERYHGAHFLVRAGSPASREAATSGEAARPDRVVDRARTGALLATPLLLALVLIELADVVFAVDSIPAIFAITTDPFLVFTSNVFAMLGLRSLYFALAGIIGLFHYLKPALALVLVVIGAKMLAHSYLVVWLGDHFNLVMADALERLAWKSLPPMTSTTMSEVTNTLARKTHCFSRASSFSRAAYRPVRANAVTAPLAWPLSLPHGRRATPRERPCAPWHR